MDYIFFKFAKVWKGNTLKNDLGVSMVHTEVRSYHSNQLLKIRMKKIISQISILRRRTSPRLREQDINAVLAPKLRLERLHFLFLPDFVSPPEIRAYCHLRTQASIREATFEMLRQMGGISGLPNPLKRNFQLWRFKNRYIIFDFVFRIYFSSECQTRHAPRRSVKD